MKWDWKSLYLYGLQANLFKYWQRFGNISGITHWITEYFNNRKTLLIFRYEAESRQGFLFNLKWCCKIVFRDYWLEYNDEFDYHLYSRYSWISSQNLIIPKRLIYQPCIQDIAMYRIYYHDRFRIKVVNRK